MAKATYRIIYRGGNGRPIEKITVRGGVIVDRDDEKYDARYHDNINRTFYDLEQQGKLNDMGPREKVFVRDLHISAQDPRYWE